MIRHLLRDLLEAFFAFLTNPVTEGLIALLCAIAVTLTITGCTPVHSVVGERVEAPGGYVETYCPSHPSECKK